MVAAIRVSQKYRFREYEDEEVKRMKRPFDKARMTSSPLAAVGCRRKQIPHSPKSQFNV